ncbi:DEAD/DEAH box helicase, partial [Planctomycetota bacterium]
MESVNQEIESRRSGIAQTGSPGHLDLSTPVQFLKGVGPGRAETFVQLGVATVADLLDYFPRDWVFAPEPTQIGQLHANETVTVVGLIESTDLQGSRRIPLFEAMIADESGLLRLVWFHGAYLQKQLRPGQVLVASGKVTEYKHQLQLTSPKFLIVKEGSGNPAEFLGGGVYPATAKLSSQQIKRILRPLLDKVENLVAEYHDPTHCRENELARRQDAYTWIHLPPDPDKLRAAQRRLKYDELFLMQLGLALRRYRVKHFSAAPALQMTEKIDRHIRRRFPFLLTGDQNEVIEQIVHDMGRSEPMNRLVQGDVGSGKTVVALYAALLAVANRRQVAIMAPTEILAGQHYLSIERYLKGSQVKR